MTKTQYAFTFSCEELFRQFENIYFWTFTFKSVPLDDSYAMEDWHVLVSRLVHYFPQMVGIRCTELHRSHGIHFHCFVNCRIPIDLMQKIIHGTGNIVGHNRYLDFGRLSVKKCDKSPESVAYLACYLTKQYREDNWFGKRRRWGAMGGFNVTRCRDIVYESTATRNRTEIFGDMQCSYTALMMVTRFSNLWGPVKDWPQSDVGLVMAQPLANGGSFVKHLRGEEQDPF